jgi:CIC family chloride channel protein
VPTLTTLGSAIDLASELGLYALLGAITGVAAAAFIRALHLLEDLFDHIGQRYLRHALGMFLVGLLMYALLRGFGHYFVEGVGYATVQAILVGGLSSMGLLALLCVCKLLATSLSLGSGSSGGIFSPSLFMGATIGGAFAAALTALHLPIKVNIPAFAMVGMAAMVGGGTGASMTAIAMIFEMTRDYQIVLPLVLAVAMSVGIRRLLSGENIYTMKLFRRGHAVPKALHANMFLVRSAKDIMDARALIVPAEESVEALLSRPDNDGHLRHIIVAQNGRISGVLRINTSLRHASAAAQSDIHVGEVASRNFIVVQADDIAFDVIKSMWRHGAAMAVVVSGPTAAARPLGVISKEHIADAVAGSIAVYPR